MPLLEDLLYGAGQTTRRVLRAPGDVFERGRQLGQAAVPGLQRAYSENIEPLIEAYGAGLTEGPGPEGAVTDDPGGGFDVSAAERSLQRPPTLPPPPRPSIETEMGPVPRPQPSGLGIEDMDLTKPYSPPTTPQAPPVGAPQRPALEEPPAGDVGTAPKPSLRYQLPGGEWKEFRPGTMPSRGGFVQADVSSLGPEQRGDYDRAALQASLTQRTIEDPLWEQRAQAQAVNAPKLLGLAEDRAVRQAQLVEIAKLDKLSDQLNQDVQGGKMSAEEAQAMYQRAQAAIQLKLQALAGGKNFVPNTGAGLGAPEMFSAPAGARG
jgi:hypothetical protein